MKAVRVLWRRVVGLFARNRRDAEFEEALQADIELAVRDNVRAGMTPEEARRSALLKFGGAELAKEQYRDQRGLPGLEGLVKDAAYAVRALLRAPVFTAVAILSLALGVGANSAFFSLADQLVIRSLPVPEPEQLVFVNWDGNFIGGTSRGGGDTFSYPTYLDLRDTGGEVFTGILARRQETVDVSSGGGSAERAVAELVSGNYFEVLRVGAVIGRPLSREHDSVRDASPYVVLAWGYWQRRFGGRHDVLNSTISVNGYPMTVIGVTERGFVGATSLRPVDLFVPLAMKAAVTPTWDDRERRDSIWLNLVARLRSGVTLERAQHAMQGPFRASLQRDFESVRSRRSADFEKQYMRNRLMLTDGRRGYLRDFFRTPLYVLCSMVGVLLLIACVNIANLLITRAAGRRKEIAIRLSLGASKCRLVRLFATEALVIGAVAGLIGLLLSIWITELLRQLMPGEDVASVIHSTPDWRIGAFTAAVTVLASMLFAIAPAVYAARADANSTLKEESTTSSMTGGQARFRKLLVCGQVAMSLTLLAAAGLFSRSLTRLMVVESGVAADQLLAFGIDPSLHRYQPEQSHRLFRELQANLSRIPGVISASGASTRILTGGSWENTVVVEGYKSQKNEDMQAGWNEPLPGFFQTIGAPLIAGRDFTERDAIGAPRVGIVNEEFAKRFCGGDNCIGRRFGFGGPPDIEIVGLVKDIRHNSLSERVRPWTYTPLLQNGRPDEMHLYLRTARRPESLANAARQAVRQLDSTLPVVDVRTTRAELEKTHYTNRVFAFLSSAFAVVAALLACIGLYGVTSYSVARRTQEFGVRVALGAGRGDIVRLVVRELMLIIVFGVAAGLAGTVIVGRYLESLLYEMKASDPQVLAGCALVMALAAAVAAWFPTRRALRIDPVRALRYE